jgi:hypothetical protein
MMKTVPQKLSLIFRPLGWLGVFLSFFLLLQCHSQSKTLSKIIFQDSFEAAPSVTDNPLTGYSSWDETCCDWSFKTSDSVSRIGGSSGRFELRVTDPSPQPNDSKRSQIIWNGLAKPTGAVWYAISIYVPAWLGTDPAPEDLFDLHDKMPNNGSSNWTNPFGVWNKNGRWVCHVTYDSLDISEDLGQSIRNTEFDLAAVVPGQWVDWVLHTNYSCEDSGYVELYMNGTKVVDYKGRCAYRGALPDPYFKFGIYKWPWAISGFNPASTTTTRTFYFDNFKVGSRLATLKDFVTSEKISSR